MLQQSGQVNGSQAMGGGPLGASGLDLSTLQVDAAVIRLVPQETARRHQLMPLQRVGGTLKVATADPTNFLALDEIRFMTGLSVEPIVAPAAALREAIERHYGWVEDNENQKKMEDLVGFADQEEAESVELEEETDDGSFNLAELEKEAEGAPVIRLVNHILTDAV